MLGLGLGLGLGMGFGVWGLWWLIFFYYLCVVATYMNINNSEM